MRTAIAALSLCGILFAGTAAALPTEASFPQPAATREQARELVGSFLAGVDAPGVRIARVRERGDHFSVTVESATGARIVDVRVDRIGGGEDIDRAEAVKLVADFLDGIDAEGVRTGKIRARDGRYEVELKNRLGMHIVDVIVDPRTRELSAKS